MDGYSQDTNMVGLTQGDMNANMLGHGQPQTLDQIINQNNQEMMRRRQTYNPHYEHQQQSPPTNRRASMLEFSSSTNGDLADFQFDPATEHAEASNQITNMNMNAMAQKRLDPRKVRSREELSLDTRFQQMPAYEGASMSAYPASMIPNTSMGIDRSSNYQPQPMDLGGGYDSMGPDISSMNITPNQAPSAIYTTSPTAANFPMSYSSNNQDPGGGASPANIQAMRMSQGANSNAPSPQRFLGRSQSQLRRMPTMPSPLSMSAQNGGMGSPAHVAPGSTAAQHHPAGTHSRRASVDTQNNYMNQGNAHMQMDQGRPVPQNFNTKWANAYSSTGFDMLAILMRVATRRNPQINIGPVDLACAFVVCDIEKHDLPIVYCSDMFERLTGYSRHEILGRNCRFLQAPDGKVQSGMKRKYCDDKSVLYLKNQISQRTEAQLSLINYRKGGQPFMNLLTMIPITWETNELKYFVGFQVDLVEQPGSVSAKNPGKSLLRTQVYVRADTTQMVHTRSITTGVHYQRTGYQLPILAVRLSWVVKQYRGTRFRRY